MPLEKSGWVYQANLLTKLSIWKYILCLVWFWLLRSFISQLSPLCVLCDWLVISLSQWTTLQEFRKALKLRHSYNVPCLQLRIMLQVSDPSLRGFIYKFSYAKSHFVFSQVFLKSYFGSLVWWLALFLWANTVAFFW